jgi:hypothetical protein
MYEYLIEAFQAIIMDLFQYAEKYRIDLPNRDRIHRNMEKAEELIEYHIKKCEKISPTRNQQQNKRMDDSTEPKIVF